MVRFDIRIAKTEDLMALQGVFKSSVSNVANKHYSAGEISEWLKSIENTQRWDELLGEQYVVMAVAKNQVSGFASLKSERYIDFKYVHGDF
jgi:putative acetyltransferase